MLLQNTIHGRECIEPEDRVLDKVNEDQSGDMLVWKNIVSGSGYVLDSPDAPLNVRYMLIVSGGVENRECGPEWLKLIISHDGLDGEAP